MPMRTVTPKELKDKLNKEKGVLVNGYNMRIRRIPLLLLSEDINGILDKSGRSKEALLEKVQAIISRPNLAMLKRVLLAGVVSPKLSEEEAEDSVAVDMVLAHHELSFGLFSEIVNFSLDS